MSCSLSLSRCSACHQAFACWRYWPATIVAMVGCLASFHLALAQDPNSVPKRAAAKDQTANEPPQSQVRDPNKLLAEQQRLLDEENKHAQAGKYAEAIKTSQQRESVLLELAKLPDRKAATNQMQLDLLAARGNWQWLSGKFMDVLQTSEQRLQLIEAEFGVQHWESVTARFARDGYRKLAAIDEPTRQRMLELEQQGNTASAKGDYREAIAKADALKDIEAKVLGVEHPFYANSLANIAGYCQQTRDYERATRERKAALTIREKALGPDHPEIGTSLCNLADLYESQGNYSAAVPLYVQAVKIYEKSLGSDHLATATILNNLAELYFEQANYATAEPLYLRALKIREKTLGPDHPYTAISLDNLAKLYMAQAKYAAAEPLLLRALKIREKAFGPDHPDTAKGLNSLAFLYQSQGNNVAAEPLYQRALKIKEKALGPDHLDTATSLNNLAGLYESQANYAAAEPLYQRALSIKEKALGPEHPGTAMSLNNLAVLHEALGNYSASKELKLRALKIHEKALGPDHPLTATSLDNLALLYAAQANYAAAEPLHQRALKIQEKALGPDHPDTVASLLNLAERYKLHGNYAAAEPLFQRALTFHEKAFGINHPATATCLDKLARLYWSQGNAVAAEPLFQRALKIRETVFGPDHLSTAASLDILADLYRTQENYAVAEPLCRRALKINENVLGPDHPRTARSLNSLAGLYRQQGNYAAAEPLFIRALEIDEKALGLDHLHTAASLNNLTVMYQLQGNYAPAEPLLRRALKIKEQTHGPDHPDVAFSLQELALFHWRRDQAEAAVPLAERALGIRLRHLDETAAIQTEQQQFLMSRATSVFVNVSLMVSGADAKMTSAVYRDVLAWKGLITARQQGLRLALKDDPLFAEFRQVTQQLSTFALSPPLPPEDLKALEAWRKREPDLRRNWQNHKATLEAEHERLEKELAVKSVTFRMSLEQRRVQPEDLVATLKSQDRPTALVDVLQYRYLARKDKDKEETTETRIVAFVVRGDRPVVRVELGSAETIAEYVDQWRESFGRKTADHDPGAELRQRVWMPLEQHLQGIETVLISPDGPLAQLPWGALPGAKPGTYLLEDRAVAVIPVPQMLPALLSKARRAGPPESLLLAGDIEYGGDPGQPQDLLAKRDAAGRQRDGRFMQFANLDAAQSELTSIKDWYEKADGSGKVNTLRKLKATEAAFSEEVSRNQWLHVITHGFFAPAALTAGPPAPTVAGIGAGLKVDGGRCNVTQLVAAGAAQKDGRLQVGDEILSVTNPNGEAIATAGKSLEEIIALIRGSVGTTVRLQVRPQSDVKQTVEVVLTRAPLPSQTVNTKPVAVHPGLLSGLAFAGANTPPVPDKDDGILTALEVAALDLNQVDAVVLSACETGLGSVVGGEGLLGLQRAFQVSGAKTVVASLWKVPDAATARLMQRFYENLWEKKLPKLQALREAQLWMLKEGARVTDGIGGRGIAVVELQPPVGDGLPPYYWAAFVLSGDWR